MTRLPSTLVLIMGVLFILSGLSGCAPERRELQRYSFTQIHMGAPARILLYAPDEAAARESARAGFARIAELDRVMSDYRQDSELMRLGSEPAGRWTGTSRDLFRVLRRSADLAEQTGGAFDFTLGPLTAIWRQARRRGAMPDPGEIAAARSSTGWSLVEFREPPPQVRLLVEGVRLDLGGIGKGFAAGEAVEAVRAAGSPRCLVDLGGDMVAGDPPPGERGWRVAVESGYGDGPHPVCSLANAALATSGDTEQYVEIEGVRFSHILDPATGLGLTSRAAATVYAPDGATADALASAACVLGPAKGREVLGPMKGVGVRVVSEGRVELFGPEASRIGAEFRGERSER